MNSKKDTSNRIDKKGRVFDVDGRYYGLRKFTGCSMTEEVQGLCVAHKKLGKAVISGKGSVGRNQGRDLARKEYVFEKTMTANWKRQRHCKIPTIGGKGLGEKKKKGFYIIWAEATEGKPESKVVTGKKSGRGEGFETV